MLGDADRLEHPLDVSVHQRPLLPARGGVRAVLEGLAIDHDVLRVRRRRARRGLRGAELRQQRPVGSKNPHELPCQRLRRLPIEVIENVPAQNSIDAFLVLREALTEKRGKLLELPFRDVPIDVLEEILDDDLAAELLAEERDIGADDRAKIEQQRLRSRVETREKLGERLGGMSGRVGAAVSGVRLVLPFTREEV